MKQIGTGNAREMEIFADEVRKDIERLGYNLEAEFEVLMEENSTVLEENIEKQIKGL